MTIWSHKEDDHGELTQVIIEVELVQFNHDRFEGGALVQFDIGGKTTARWAYFDDGKLVEGGEIWTRDGRWSADECLKYCEEEYRK